MTIEVLNRGFVMAIPNEDQDMYLHIRCSENHMEELARFVRFDALGFKQLRGGKNYITNAHKVSSNDGVVEAPNGKIFFEIIDGNIHFKPLNGSVRGYDFKTSLDRMATVIIRETKQSRWDDYCLGELGYDGHVVYFYSHLLLDNVITITDRWSFYITLHKDELGWKTGQTYITHEMWETLAEIHRTDSQLLPTFDVPLKAQALKIMRANNFNSVKDVKEFFNQP